MTCVLSLTIVRVYCLPFGNVLLEILERCSPSPTVLMLISYLFLLYDTLFHNRCHQIEFQKLKKYLTNLFFSFTIYFPALVICYWQKYPLGKREVVIQCLGNCMKYIFEIIDFWCRKVKMRYKWKTVVYMELLQTKH